MRFDRGYARVYNAAIACTWGPNPPAGTPTGDSARVASPHTSRLNSAIGGQSSLASPGGFPSLDEAGVGNLPRTTGADSGGTALASQA
jgi:hypothetical protein